MAVSRIMVIDDEPAVHRLLQIILEEEGFEVIGIGSHESLKGRISMGKPDLIILDIRMPEVSGLDVLRMLKSDEGTRAIPVVVLTASNRHRDKELAKKLGALAYVTKPFQPSELLKTIRSASPAVHADPLPG